MRKRTFVTGSIAVILSALGACSSQDSPPTAPTDGGGTAETSTSGPDGATDGASGGSDGGKGGDAGSTPTDGGVAADTGADVAIIVDSGTDTGPADTGIDTGVDSGPPVINGCTSFEDATAVAANRTLVWDFPIAVDPRRCLMIAKGQTVTFATPIPFHPLGAKDGTVPTPIPASTTTAAGGIITFPNAGTYGYVCLNHPSMTGAIKVLP